MNIASFRRRSASRGSLTLRIITAAALTFMAIPTVVVVLYSFNGLRSLVLHSGWSVKWYAAAWEPELRDPMLRSLWVAVAVMTISTVLGTATAFSLTRGNQKIARASLVAIVTRLITPETATAVATFLIFANVGAGLGTATLLAAHVAYCMPFMTVVVLSALRNIDGATEEAAMDLGCSRLRAVWKAVLPPLLPTVMAAALLAFIISFTDFITSQYTAGLTAPTLPVRIYNARGGATPAVDAIGVIMLLIVCAVIGIGALIALRISRKRLNR